MSRRARSIRLPISTPSSPRSTPNQRTTTMFDLTGKRALVTGASGGIGREIAKALAAAGATVALSGTRTEALEAVAGEIGANSPILPCNLSDLASVDQLVPQAEAALGGIDILVNNAGITRDNLFMRMK
ncbi:MAG: SDR family NAD(P)-dependent oxidoreductase, partial [Devosia nanyangense]|nr:SDR family NAD(P)-dependent oxidoreductase [Devosia nanyangense]